MIDIELLHEADKRCIINRKHVLWWQLGFEGRRIYSDEEFDKNLEEISYDVEKGFYDKNAEKGDLIKKTFKVWTKDDVPILIKDVNIGGLNLPCFVSVKPMSHSDGAGDGWRSLKINKSYNFPTSAFHEPHVRGIIIDTTKDFLFWYPISLGREPSYYGGAIAFRPKGEKMICLVNPVHPKRFYENLIRDQWSHGRRHNKKGEEFNCKKNNFEIVPYYEFNLEKQQVMVYPAPVGKHKLDFPVIIKSNPSLKKPEILGIGYLGDYLFDYAVYWNINEEKQRQVKKSLIERLGKI